MENTIRTNSPCPVIAGVSISTDKQGRFNLNALHKASGLGNNKAPSQWLRTKSSQELVQELTDMQKCTSPLSTVKGGINQGTFAHELLAISYAGWISPKFQLTVNQVFLDYRSGRNSAQVKVDVSGLPEYRKARAIKEVYSVAEKLCSHLPNLSEQSKQAIYAGLINPIAGKIIPLPMITEKYYTAKEVGEILDISGKKVGLIANKYNLKVADHGMWVLEKAQHSDKQVSNFRYSEKGIQAIKSYMEA